MGVHEVHGKPSDNELRRFTMQLIDDVRAIEYMLDEEMFESGVHRIGAEQELFLVDKQWQPAPLSEEILARSQDPRVVSELTRYNLELNLKPVGFGGTALSEVESQLTELLAYVGGLAEEEGAQLVLTGILPTIHLSDLEMSAMSPQPRYFALNDAIQRLRGGPAQFQIRGTDELFFRHDSILVEGCNTSFQTHFQVGPKEFARFYNIAQAIAAPCLSVAANSPILFGKRLWHETRIALFQQAVDTRSSNLYLREMSPRVHFGTCWVDSSATEIYKEDIARFRVLLTAEDEDAFEVLRAGGIPKLRALQVHNGTVYRWNRACYGIMGGMPHLRIENRILPSGPSVVDEVANAAFWFGLVAGLGDSIEDMTTRMEFDDAKSNFVTAARLGLGAQLTWLDGRSLPVRQLVLEELLPIAEAGLKNAGFAEADVKRYLTTIEKRVELNRTGAAWQLASVSAIKKSGTRSTRAERLNALVAAMVKQQQTGSPVHEWPLATLSDVVRLRHMKHTRVEHFMSTELFTVNEDELVELVACLMDWRRIRHVVVEDNQQRIVGLVTHRNLLRYIGRRGDRLTEGGGVPVKEIMVRNPLTVSPETSTIEAVHLMREKEVSALPVVTDGQLVGMITDTDFYSIAGDLLDDSAAESPGLPKADQ